MAIDKAEVLSGITSCGILMALTLMGLGELCEDPTLFIPGQALLCVNLTLGLLAIYSEKWANPRKK